MSALAMAWLLLPGSLITLPAALPAAAPDDSLTRAIQEVQNRCYECHANENTKGGLLLDDVLGWRENVDLESPEDSELLYRMRLPRDDGDAMPPEGERVSDETIARLQQWVEAGADEAPVQKSIDEVLSRSIRRQAQMDSTLAATGAAIERVPPPGGGKSVVFRVSWSHSPAVPTGEQIAQLFRIAEGTLELSFAGTEVTDELLTHLPMLPALERAHLERTNLTDAGVATLIERAPALRYLNVHSTNVSAQLHEVVRPLKDLEELVTFNTAADTAPQLSPFAVLQGQQPRRILALGAGNPAGAKAALIREAGLGSHEFLWERSPSHPEASCGVIQWLGDAPRPEGTNTTGPDDGHGTVLMQDGPGHLIEVDTRTNRVTKEHRLRGQIQGFHQSLETHATLVLLSSGGDSRYLVEIAPTGTRRTRPVSDFPTLSLTHARHAQRLSSGTAVQVQGQAPLAPEVPKDEEAPLPPQLIERDAEGKVIWTFTEPKRFKDGLVAAQIIERTPPMGLDHR